MGKSKRKVKSKAKAKAQTKSEPKSQPSSKSNYVKVPQAEPEILERLEVIIDVLSGAKSVSDGGRALGLSRNHFQTLKNSTLEAMIENLRPRPSGRPSKQTEATKLQAQLSDAEDHIELLQRELQTQQRIIDNLTDMVREYSAVARAASRSKTRSRTTKKKATTKSTADDDDRLSRLHEAQAMQRRGMKLRDAARAVGISETTLRRWAQRHAHQQPLAQRPGPGPNAPPSADVTQRVVGYVRHTRGLAGAETVRRAVPEVSRRQAAAIKAQTLTDIERERKRDCGSVTVTQPGVVRGFDAMHLVERKSRTYALASADAAIPFRTSIIEVGRYDGIAVAAALDADFTEHGAPLVLRLDRASCHRAADVDAVLARHEVLRLHGPPHHPGYYGQLERQNREHRAWRRAGPPGEDDDLELMRTVLNDDLPRRSLNWRTSAQCWNERPTIDDDREALRHEVTTHVQRLHRDGIDLDLAQRLAIEQALIRRNYLHIQPGGRC